MLLLLISYRPSAKNGLMQNVWSEYSCPILDPEGFPARDVRGKNWPYSTCFHVEVLCSLIKGCMIGVDVLDTRHSWLRSNEWVWMYVRFSILPQLILFSSGLFCLKSRPDQTSWITALWTGSHVRAFWNTRSCLCRWTDLQISVSQNTDYVGGPRTRSHSSLLSCKVQRLSHPAVLHAFSSSSDRGEEDHRSSGRPTLANYHVAVLCQLYAVSTAPS